VRRRCARVLAVDEGPPSGYATPVSVENGVPSVAKFRKDGLQHRVVPKKKESDALGGFTVPQLAQSPHRGCGSRVMLRCQSYNPIRFA